MNDINESLSNYLKSKKGLNKLMNAIKVKYETYSKTSGVIKLNNITDLESKDIGDLLGKKIIVNSNLKTSFKELTKKINEGKYNGFTWEGVLNNYFNGLVITSVEKKTNYIKSKEEYLNSLYKNNINKKYVKELFNIIENNTNIKQIINRKYNKNKEELEIEINNILILLDNIPSIPTPLPMYSSLIGNPHYLDLNLSSSNLFLKIVSIIKGLDYKNNLQSKLEILNEINVYNDPISNYVITYKLIGNNILSELNEKNQVVNLNLLNVNDINYLTTDIKKVFIFENPSMLNTLKKMNVPIIITSGMPNICFYEVINKLSKENKIYYNGDYDPEGLLIADKIKERFPNIELFCYTLDDINGKHMYTKACDSRIKKLELVKSKDLKIVKNKLINDKVCIYQEQNIDRIKEFILDKIK